jgi:monoamine oxidase
MIFDTKKHPAWFSSLNTVVTSSPLRYVLPIDSKKGVLQCSYTEGSDTELYMKLYNTRDETALQKKILQDLQTLFPEVSIPTPTFFKVHFWETGTTYWLPGTYDPEKVSMASLNPLPSVLPSVWLCGESWSLQQAWIEGALEQTELCFTEMKKAHCIERE